MKNKKISVIVCVYNTEKYVGKCLESLLKQTYKNLEILVIEDGSTDNSKKVLEKFKDNKNIRLIYNEKNSGLAFSRNVGMENATGEYLGFIDSDDYVAPDYFEKLYNTLVDNKADVSICDMKLVYENENNREVISNCYDEGKFNFLNVIKNGLVASACNKLFKKELITKYQFAVGKVNEDIAVVIPALVGAKKIAYAEDCYYNYVQRDNSIQNSNFSERRFDIIEAVDTTLERIEGCKNFDEIKHALVYNQIIVLFIYVIPKDNRFFYRQKVLRKFNKLTKKYEIRMNKGFWYFLDCSPKKHEMYYKLLFKFECNGLYLLANLMISFYKFYTKSRKKSVIAKKIDMTTLIEEAKKQQAMKEEKYKISVVVPNYNYEKFMFQRLYSILNQNYKLSEIIILDDCSKDNSRELIDKIVEELKPYIDIKRDFNKTNSGTAFKQWEKGFKKAKGDYVWIAEADDYCKSTLLSTLIKPVKKDNEVVLSYADTAFINSDGGIILKTIKPEIDIRKTGHWNKSYINDGKNELENYTFLNCTVANVSSCIIKKNNYDDYLKESCDYKQAGDWVFYANVMQEGKIAFTNKVLNYYRVHGNNVSSTMNRKKHIDEINKIHSKFVKENKLGKFQKDEMKKRVNFLKKVWEVK